MAFAPITPPSEGESVTKLWKVVALLCKAVNSMLKTEVRRGTTDRYTVSEGNTVIEYSATGGTTAAAVAVLSPWTPIPAPFVGTGTPPTNQGLNMMVRPGSVAQFAPKVPASKNKVFAVPANCTDGYYVWLEATLDNQGQMISLDWQGGVTLPTALLIPPVLRDSYPPAAYDVLFMVTSTQTTVNYAGAVQMRTTPLKLVSSQIVTDIYNTVQINFEAA